MIGDHFLRAFEYDRWANGRVLERLDPDAFPDRKPARLLAHVLEAADVWMRRLHGEGPQEIDLWPRRSRGECEARIERVHSAYLVFINELTEEEFGRPRVYRNTKGTEFRTPTADILAHVATHGVHHRGQIATALRRAGDEPADTQFIAFSRGS